MTRFRIAILFFGLTSLVHAVGASDNPSSALGQWITQSGNLQVEIKPCGEALCGTVVRVLANNSMSKPGEVMEAADARPALGMKILSSFVAAGEGEWKGQIYNRENGKTYDCRISPISGHELKVRAYRFLPLFGKTQIWTRTDGLPQS